VKIGCAYFVGIWLSCALGQTLTADILSFGGSITQSTGDGTGPATNNSTLDNVQDSQTYAVTLILPGSITAPGTYDLTGSSLKFFDLSAMASESAFGSITVTITEAGGIDTFSMLACLTSGSDCSAGNQLDADFQIAFALRNASGSTVGLDLPHPLDLLEDDGVTDIQGSIDSYSYIGVPEPSYIPLLLAAGALFVKIQRNRIKSQRLLLSSNPAGG